MLCLLCLFVFQLPHESTCCPLSLSLCRLLFLALLLTAARIRCSMLDEHEHSDQEQCRTCSRWFKQLKNHETRGCFACSNSYSDDEQQSSGSVPLAPAQPGTSQFCDSAAHRLSSDVDKPTHELPFQAEAPGPQAHTQEPTLHNYVRDYISDTVQQMHSDLAASQPVPSLA